MRYIVFMIMWITSCYFVDTYYYDIGTAYIMLIGYATGLISLFITGIIKHD